MPQSIDPFQYYARLARLRRYVAANLARPISLADAACIVALEKKYFSRFFKTRVGTNFSSWLMEQRITRAAALLRERNHSIAHLALQVGFRDLRTFERRFKQVQGVTPREFRMRVRMTAGAHGSRNVPESER